MNHFSDEPGCRAGKKNQGKSKKSQEEIRAKAKVKSGMRVIEGNLHRDERGVVRFVNDFDMSRVVRMYCIEPKLGVIRAWQGHQKESKWFYAAKGSFLVKTVEMDSLKRKEYILKDKESIVLEIPGGYYNGFEALEEESVLMVFSNFGLEVSKEDDFRESVEVIKW